MDGVLQVRILNTYIDVVFDKQVGQPFIIVENRVMQRAIPSATLLKVDIHGLVLGVVDINHFRNFFKIPFFRSNDKLFASFEIRFPPRPPRFFIKVSHLLIDPYFSSSFTAHCVRAALPDA
jgi:hypothetical protein